MRRASASPQIMGIVNVTPDSFSDGGLYASAEAAVAHGLALAEQGADILDIGGESTRPGSDEVSAEAEMDRVLPVIAGLRAAGCAVPVSVDTRHAKTMLAVLKEGVAMINDVTALRGDEGALDAIKNSSCKVCLMHMQGQPKTMQNNPSYNNVLEEVFEFLNERISFCETNGIEKSRLVIDPGIGFGKDLNHNLALLKGLSRFHDLGVPVLLGASRKRFIEHICGPVDARERFPGSIAAALHALAQGVQILRVHDVAQTLQAVKVWRAIEGA